MEATCDYASYNMYIKWLVLEADEDTLSYPRAGLCPSESTLTGQDPSVDAPNSKVMG